ncbi:MAG: ADP-ribosylglycohydrolase family protein [Bacillota bacterium]
MDVRNGLFGLAVADALGVPVEFTDREKLKENPVTDMRGNGTHHQPKGTWSDDTSMALCLAASLAGADIDYTDIMDKFCRWWIGGDYTPHGYAFDIGGATGRALSRFREGTEPLLCGGTAERDNGNGALMRILPAAYLVHELSLERGMDIVHSLTALTHAHPRALIASGIYVRICLALLGRKGPANAVAQALTECREYYEAGPYAAELKHYSRLMNGIGHLPEEEIKSTGYVVDTLEAAAWCLLNTRSYRDCVLRAVNLGDDTDTVAAIAGGMAGIYYGVRGIPAEWMQSLARADVIETVCGALQKKIS